MKIKELFISRYGPLVYNTALRLKDFNLFYGKNEDGKTLTIDAIVKLFFRRQAKEFHKIDRVDEMPEGYLIIEDKDGREVKFPEKGDLMNHVDLFPVDYRNIFIIRNSDLSISREGEFYTGIADRLTGLRMDKIQKVKEALLERAKITPGGTFRDKKGEKLKTRVEAAEKLIEKAESLIKRINGESYDTLEEDLVQQRERIEMLERYINDMEDARKRESYEKGCLAIGTLENSKEKLDELTEYTEADESFWRERQRDIERLNTEKDQLLAELQLKEKRFDTVKKELDREQREFDLLNEKKSCIDEEVKPLLKSYEQRKSEQEGERSKKGLLTVLWIFFLVLTAVSLYGLIIKPVFFMYFPFILSALSTVIVVFLKLKYIRGNAWLFRTFSNINSSILKLGLNADSPRNIWLNVQKFDDSYKARFDKLNALRLNNGILEREINSLHNEKIPEYDSKIATAQKDMKEIMKKTGERTLQEYKKKLIEKQKYSALIVQQENLLQSIFGNAQPRTDNDLNFWKKRVAELERYRERAKDLEYKEKELEKLKIDRESCRLRVAEIDERMGSIQNDLLEIEREANKIIRPEGDYYHCKTSLDLNVIGREISIFIQSNREMKDHTLEVLELLEEVELEKKEKVSELFEKESAVSRYFSNITEGRYTEVTLNPDTMGIEVFRNDNRILDAERLSSGTYDQLYLAIRIALGEKILKQERGFFILDDPFIRSDTERLDKQIDTLTKISSWGWQIIYFSAKEEIRQRLEKDIQKDKIALFELPGTLL